MRSKFVVAIGGVGGSGTRAVAEIVQSCGFFIGGFKNRALDNLWFNFLILQPQWLQEFPKDHELEKAIGVFVRGMMRLATDDISEDDRAYIRNVASSWVEHVPNRVWADDAREFLGNEYSINSGQSWGWKEPNTHIYLPQLIKNIPNLQYVHVVRNGFDMAFSQNVNQLNAWKEFFDLDLDTAKPLPSQLLDYWIAANTRAIAIGENQLGKNFYNLNYDLLVATPESEIYRLAEFLNAQLTDASIEAMARQIKSTTVGRHSGENKNLFSAAQLEAVEALGHKSSFNPS